MCDNVLLMSAVYISHYWMQIPKSADTPVLFSNHRISLLEGQ